MNANANEEQILDAKLADLELELDGQFEHQMEDLAAKSEHLKTLGQPDNLGKVLLGITWDNFLVSIGAGAGKDFIEENRGLHLDLRNSAHIQTTDNFYDGKLATHNTYVDYQKRREVAFKRYKTDENGKAVIRLNPKTNEPEIVLSAEARKDFDQNRPVGKNGMEQDHVKPIAKIVRDRDLQAHTDVQEQVAYANSKENLQEIPRTINREKGGKDTEEYLSSKDKNGQTPEERHPELDAEAMREKDRISEQKYQELKQKGIKRDIETGKKSQKEEALRIGKQMLRAAVMRLLAELGKSMFAGFVRWIKSAHRKFSELMSYFKESMKDFIKNLKKYLFNVAKSIGMTLLTAIFGPIVSLFTKAWTLLKQGWKSLKDAVLYLLDPKNRNQPLSILLLEASKIIIAGLGVAATLLLGEALSKALVATLPALAVEIPLLGSLSNIIGSFLGGLIPALISAIALNLIDHFIINIKKRIARSEISDVQNDILYTSEKRLAVGQVRTELQKRKSAREISKRHEDLKLVMNGAAREKSMSEINASHEKFQASRARMEMMLKALNS